MLTPAQGPEPYASIAVSRVTPAGATTFGAWDVGPFDNDDATDWFGILSEDPSWESVQTALEAGAARNGYLEVDVASVAVAAAAIVAAMKTGELDALPLEGRSSVARLGKPPGDLAHLALEALSRVQADSELAELWAEGGDPSPWIATLDSIRAGLR
ncbi:MAG: DUF4259 domain-containing protein [Brevundimonas sp.]|uniref:DUF4259 domain-containing protein n=1 Tax=Brevundimonas sp. TaxID=1871086 RepID=UPI001A23F3CD|nr:DUF4259 domain-containing protein [Brevundimonas sp.]MBJ7448297.1 DUF4259 domain-containing protein [Brevundimonas sp.]